jgi:hypothetical protein
MIGRVRAAAVVVIVLVLSGTAAYAQTPLLTGYLQTVPLASSATDLTESNVNHFNRFRISSEPVFGPVRIEAAYEHVLTLRQRETPLGLGVGAVPGGGEWLDLQWTIAEEEHVLWQHRFDRLHVGWAPADNLELTAGRQAVSWGTTLFLTPSDPFSPFNPADPFRQFRAGIDAARVRMYPSTLSEIDIVVRPSDSEVGEELTALARGLTTWRNWELSGWGGSLYGDTAGAFGVTGALGTWALRGEAVVRSHRNDVVFRGTVGVDRQVQLRGRDLFVIIEYQRDNLGGTSPEEYLEILMSETFKRGEHQVFGRDETVLQASYQLHPLWSLSGLWLWNLNDRSALISPSVAYSAGDETTISGGVFLGFGASASTPERPLPSEFGLAGTTGYVSLSWFF